MRLTYFSLFVSWKGILQPITYDSREGPAPGGAPAHEVLAPNVPTPTLPLPFGSTGACASMKPQLVLRVMVVVVPIYDHMT
jgi:hypothetical protein